MLVRLGLALAAMASAPLHNSLKLWTSAEAVGNILRRYHSYERIAFVGYSGQGYKDPGVVDRAFADAVSHCEADRCLVIAGATPEGIGRVYDLAHGAKIEAVGIVSSRALENTRKFEVDGDHLFVIDDHEWRGAGSFTSDAMVKVSTHMVGVGGDAVGGFEMTRFALRENWMPNVVALATRMPKFWPAQSGSDGECHEAVMGQKELFDVAGDTLFDVAGGLLFCPRR